MGGGEGSEFASLGSSCRELVFQCHECFQCREVQKRNTCACVLGGREGGEPGAREVVVTAVSCRVCHTSFASPYSFAMTDCINTCAQCHANRRPGFALSALAVNSLFLVVQRSAVQPVMRYAENKANKQTNKNKTHKTEVLCSECISCSIN